jgi:hypothetical protein
MSRFRIIRALLVVGAIAGFAHGFHSLRHHRMERLHEWHQHEHACERAESRQPR